MSVGIPRVSHAIGWIAGGLTLAGDHDSIAPTTAILLRLNEEGEARTTRMVKPTKFEIKQRVNGQSATLAIAGELDMRTAEQLLDCLAEQRANGVTDVTVDLTELSFMDSSGLKALIDLHDRSRTESWELSMIAPEYEAAALVLRATGADRVLPFTRTASQ
jgi:anti-anti-sigma factor